MKDTKKPEIKPDELSYYNSLANILTDQGKFDEAIACYQKVLNALQINANFEEALNNMGATLKDLGRSDEALTYFQKALHIDPDLIAVHRSEDIYAVL